MQGRNRWSAWVLGSLLSGGVLVGCVAKDGLVGEIDAVAGAAGAAAAGAGGLAEAAGAPPMLPVDSRSTRFWLDQIRNPPAPPEDGVCLPYSLPLQAGRVNCRAYGAELQAGECCSGPLRNPVSASVAVTVRNELRESGACGVTGQPACTDYCVCEIAEATGEDAAACRDPYTGGGDGWCYIAPAQGFGEPDSVRDCPAENKERVNFAGDAALGQDEMGFLACVDERDEPEHRDEPEPAALGEECLPNAELRPDFNGFQVTEVTVSAQRSCESGLCLVNHFQGRVSCPYGQPPGDSGCYVPGSDALVTVEVPPQLKVRRAALASICSCRCAGPGPGPFCDCAAGQECAPVVSDPGIPGSEGLVGSYCVPQDSLYDPLEAFKGGENCAQDPKSCGPARPY